MGFDGEADAIDRRFRYWRLSYFLASKEQDVPRSIPPAKETPAGNDVSPGAPLHSDVDAIDLAGRIDAAVRRLAQLDARIASGQAVLPSEVWTTLIHAIHVFRPVTGRKSSSYHAIEQVKPDLMEVLVALACHYGSEIPQRLVDTFTQKFEEWSEGWPLTLRLSLADELRSAGARVPWYRETLSAMEGGCVSKVVEI